MRQKIWTPHKRVAFTGGGKLQGAISNFRNILCNLLKIARINFTKFFCKNNLPNYFVLIRIELFFNFF